MCCFFPIPEPYSCFTPVLALSPSKGWTTLFFPFLSHSCSCPVAFKRLDNPFFHSCPIPALALSPSKACTTLFSIPALPLFPSHASPTLFSTPPLFLLFLSP